MLVKIIAIGTLLRFFFVMFSTSALRKVGHLLIIRDGWMADMMIIYIKKIIAKALDINGVINFVMEMSTQ
jgi:hypothetical protein